MQLHQQRTNNNNDHTNVCDQSVEAKPKINCPYQKTWNAKLFNVTSHISSSAAASHTRMVAHWLPWNDHTGSAVTVSLFRCCIVRRRSWIIYYIILFDHKFLHINFRVFLADKNASRMPFAMPMNLHVKSKRNVCVSVCTAHEAIWGNSNSNCLFCLFI